MVGGPLGVLAEQLGLTHGQGFDLGVLVVRVFSRARMVLSTWISSRDETRKKPSATIARPSVGKENGAGPMKL